MDFSTSKLRNIAIAGHGQTGKTSLLEHLLLLSGVISKAETTESGKTVSDYSPEEIERKISIYASLAHITWNDCNLNFWDTPGASDFIGELISAFRSSEMCLMMIDGRSGAQIETIKLWRDLDRRNKPRFIFINKCEDERTNVADVNKDIHDKFNVEVCPITIPMGNGANFKGVIDVLNGKAYFTPAAGEKEKEADIPAEYMDEYKRAVEVLAGSAAEGDDDLLVKFIDEGELTSEEIARGLSIAFANNRIVPSFAGSALLNSGLTSVLNFIVSTAPNPEGFIDTVKTPEGETSTIKVDPSLTMSAGVVKN